MIDNDKITGTQLCIFITMTVIGVGVFSLPRAVAEAADSDGWISVIIGGLIALLDFYLISKIAKKFPGDTLVEIANKVLGKYIAAPLLLLFWMYILTAIAMILRIFGEVVKMSLLIRTPIEIIIISLLILTLALARCGIEPIVRFDEITFPVIMLLFLFLILFALPRTDFTNILPFMRAGPTKLLKGAYFATFSYAGFEMVFFIIPFLKNPDKIFKTGAIAFLFVGAIYVSAVILSFGKFGVSDVKKLIWPTLSMIRVIEIPGSFVERLEGLVMALWVILAFTSIVPFTYCLAVIPSRVMKHNEFKHFCAIVIPIIFIIALVPDNVVESYKYLEYIIKYLETPSIFILPILLLIVSYARKLGVGKNG